MAVAIPAVEVPGQRDGLRLRQPFPHDPVAVRLPVDAREAVAVGMGDEAAAPAFDVPQRGAESLPAPLDRLGKRLKPRIVADKLRGFAHGGSMSADRARGKRGLCSVRTTLRARRAGIRRRVPGRTRREGPRHPGGRSHPKDRSRGVTTAPTSLDSGPHQRRCPGFAGRSAFPISGCGGPDLSRRSFRSSCLLLAPGGRMLAAWIHRRRFWRRSCRCIC